MNKLLAVVLCIVLPVTVLAGDNGYKVTYDGGSITDAKAGTGDETVHRLEPSTSRKR